MIKHKESGCHYGDFRFYVKSGITNPYLDSELRIAE
jgi:hypothetical protein